MNYIDIGLNLFCKQFRDPNKIIADATAENVSCILTGTDMKENEKINKYVSTIDSKEKFNQLLQSTLDALKQYPQFSKYIEELENVK